MNTDKSGEGVKWFFYAVFLFLIVYFHKPIWAVLKLLWQHFIEPILSR